MTTLQRSRRLRPPRGDEGFSMMEAIVAALILAISSALVAAMLINILNLTTNSSKRTAAANLAASQLEAVRQVSATTIANGMTTSTQAVGNTTYTVNQEASFLTTSGASNACSGTGSLAYKRVTVWVTWPGMGSTKPVKSETLRALGFDASSGGLDATQGALGVLIVNEAGQPVSNATVTVTPGSLTGTPALSQVTPSDGCVIFTGLTAGTTYYSSVTRPGYVSAAGKPSQADTGNGISANSLTKRTMSIGAGGSLVTSYSQPAGSTRPDLPITVSSTLWSPSTKTVSQVTRCPDGADGVCLYGDYVTVTPLYPGAYGVAMPCGTAATLTAVPSGGSATAPAFQLGAVSLKSTGATTQVMATCGGTTVNLGYIPASTSAPALFALPPGTWTIKRILLGGTATTVTVTAGTTAAGTVIP